MLILRYKGYAIRRADALNLEVTLTATKVAERDLEKDGEIVRRKGESYQAVQQMGYYKKLYQALECILADVAIVDGEGKTTAEQVKGILSAMDEFKTAISGLFSLKDKGIKDA